MRYILKESQVSSLITKYLYENFGDLNYNFASDDWGNENDCALEFYSGDYSDEEIVFKYYQQCWWDIENGTAATLEMYNKSPMIIFENAREYDTLNGYFGSKWIEPFKKMFWDVYDLKVKTIEY
jgi:hypothetical protein